MEHIILPFRSALDKATCYRKTIKNGCIKWYDYLKRATLCKWLHSAPERLHRHLAFCHGCDRRRQSQTDPARGMESYAFYIREIKASEETYFIWCIIFHIILLCFSALCTVKLRPTNATAAKPHTDLCSTMTWHILAPNILSDSLLYRGAAENTEQLPFTLTVSSGDAKLPKKNNKQTKARAIKHTFQTLYVSARRSICWEEDKWEREKERE